MGYYTDYELTIDPDSDEIYDDLVDTYEDAAYAFSNSQQSSWDTAENDLTEFSKKYPGHIFILEGHGQEFDDVWQKHFKNGQVTHFKGRIIFEEST